MSTESASTGGNTRYKPKKTAILGMGLLFFTVLALVAMALCNFRVQYATQAILNQQREVQQTWLDKSLDAIRAWRNELVEQAHFISSSEMFRLFAVDTQNLSHDEFALLAEPEALHSNDENIRTMAEQMTYMQDLLGDFTRRRAWNDARILLPDGTTMVAPQFSAPLTPEQLLLAQNSVSEGHPLFGPVRQGKDGLIMEMADPLFEVLGSSTPKIVAVLLSSLPMDKPLSTFLSRNGEQMETLLPRIVNMEHGNPFMILANAGKVMIEPVAGNHMELANMPFMRRQALDGRGEVYSIGGMPTGLKWLFVLETPAAEIDALIHSQKMQIYALGFLGSIGIALLAAWIWAGHQSRKHEAEAIRYQKLYNTINNQKLMLDSINASFKAGLLLVDEYGRVQMSNPAFREICGLDQDIPPATPLVQCLPSKAAVSMLEDMGRVRDMEQSASVELTIPTSMKDRPTPEDRLYRITLYPYSEESTGAKKGGCVAILQDITEFRRKAREERAKAENERMRQAALISAFVHAVESLDPNLVGHSDKMTRISELLGRELELDEQQEETLKLAAKLSQVGKMFVPRELLTKQGKLSPEELAEMRRVPEYADKILHDLHFDLPVRETVREIGERVDGSGKPSGLTGEQISLCGRALAVVNAFIAMTSKRAWRKDGSMSIEEAIKKLRSDNGFDQKIVGALAQLSTDEMAEIIKNARQA